MAQIQAVQCDACDRIDKPEEDATIPEYWLLVDIDQQGAARLNGAVYCSWECLIGVAQRHASPAPKKRKRRTRAEMEADARARRPAPAPSPAASV
jgi:hypothetical protein